ncbi:hypothetical protein N0V85_003699 [Neurospora sp. IMI 360204]|nr:hypothetical protein N0V85_003699 [Neurospora sp. IMI 360204]
MIHDDWKEEFDQIPPSPDPLSMPFGRLSEQSSAKSQKTKQTNPNLPEIPLAEVHAAFVEFQAKERDKCLSAKCTYCNQVRAENTSRQTLGEMLLLSGPRPSLKTTTPTLLLHQSKHQPSGEATMSAPRQPIYVVNYYHPTHGLVQLDGHHNF